VATTTANAPAAPTERVPVHVGQESLDGLASTVVWSVPEPGARLGSGLPADHGPPGPPARPRAGRAGPAGKAPPDGVVGLYRPHPAMETPRVALPNQSSPGGPQDQVHDAPCRVSGVPADRRPSATLADDVGRLLVWLTGTDGPEALAPVAPRRRGDVPGRTPRALDVTPPRPAFVP
jgi:hypothetical protein